MTRARVELAVSEAQRRQFVIPLHQAISTNSPLARLRLRIVADALKERCEGRR